jgi:hypothetical protein
MALNQERGVAFQLNLEGCGEKWPEIRKAMGLQLEKPKPEGRNEAGEADGAKLGVSG